MDKLAVTGDTIVLEAPPGVTFLAPAIVTLSGQQVAMRITAGRLPVILEADLPTCAATLPVLPYSTPTHTIPGVLTGLQLTVTTPTLSKSVAASGQKVITAGTTGTYTMSIGTPPAMMPPPGPGSPVPDAVAMKTGKWSVKTAAQPFFASGTPKSPEDDGDDGDGVGPGGGAGAGKDNDASADSQVHFVAVTLEDADGNPLASQFVDITIPSGERFRRQLTGAGGTRVDDIQKEGDRTALVNMVFNPDLVPTTDGDDGAFIAFEVIDEEGQPLAAENLTLTFDGKEPVVVRLNDRGRSRVEDVDPETECLVELGGELPVAPPEPEQPAEPEEPEPEEPEQPAEPEEPKPEEPETPAPPPDPTEETDDWTATWESDKVAFGEVRKMQLDAPGLPAGTPLKWTVEQEEFGVVGSIDTQSEANSAVAEWSDWVHPESAPGDLELEPGEEFPVIRFKFKVEGAGLNATTDTPITYEDRLEVRVGVSASEATPEFPETYRYAVHTLWGSRKGTSTKVGEEDGFIVEERLPPGGASVVTEDDEALKGSNFDG